jgi:hypothetical protein
MVTWKSLGIGASPGRPCPGSLVLSPEGSGWKQPLAAAALPSIDFELYCIPNGVSPRAWGAAQRERTDVLSGTSGPRRRASGHIPPGDRTLWSPPAGRRSGFGFSLARCRIGDTKGARLTRTSRVCAPPSASVSGGEPLLAASCNMLAAWSRSKPSRWWETTRAEQDRSDGIDWPKRGLPLGSGRDRWKSAEGRS